DGIKARRIGQGGFRVHSLNLAPKSPMYFQTLTSFVIAAFTIGAVASPTPEVSTKMTVAEMKNWVATTDSELTFVGDINELGVNPFVTTVTFCSTRTNQLCSGPCTVFTGSSQCIH
ncbi:unnamed protein product, partial [Mycena citricolor]